MRQYSDRFSLEVWHRMYPVGHAWFNTHGGKIIDKQHMTKAELQNEMLSQIDNEEFSGMHISREEL